MCPSLISLPILKHGRPTPKTRLSSIEMSSEPHKLSIEPGDAARSAEREPRPAPMSRIEGGTSARESERARDTAVGRTVHGFTLSARGGKPFRFEEGTSQTAGEAQPAEKSSTPPEIEVKRSNFFNDKKFAHDDPLQHEQASDDSANTSFRALSNSFLRALFRRRTH